MSTTLTVKDVIFTGGQRATAHHAVDVSMETLTSVWAGALRASEHNHAGVSDVQYEYDYSSPQPSQTPSISPHLQKNKQLQDTLQQREEEVIRLQQENNTLRRFLNSALIPNLQEKNKKLPLDTRRKLKRSLLQSDDNRTSQNLKTTTTSLRKRVCRNLLPELCAVTGPPPISEEPDPLDLWVLRTLGLKDPDTIDTSALPPPSECRHDRMSPPHHPAALSCPSQYRFRGSSDYTEVTSPHSAVLSFSSSSCEYGLEAILTGSPFASSNPPRLIRESSDYCPAPDTPAAFNPRAAVNLTASPETDITTSLPRNCSDATAHNAPVQDCLGPLDGCPNFTAVASANQYGVNVSVTDNYHPAGSCQPALSQRDGEMESTEGLTLTPPPAFLSDQVQSLEWNPGGYLANQSTLLHRSDRSQSQQQNVQFTRQHLLSPVLSSSPEQFGSPLPHNEDQPQTEFTSSPQTLRTSAAISPRADHLMFYQSPCLQRGNRSPAQENVPPQTQHCPTSPVMSKRPPERFSSNEHCHPPTSPPGGAAVSTQDLPRCGTDVAFSMSLSPSCSVKTHSFPQGQAFVKRDTQGQWRFTWVPKQGP